MMEQGSGTHNPFNRYRRPSKARQKQSLCVKRVTHLRAKEIQIKDSDRRRVHLRLLPVMYITLHCPNSNSNPVASAELTCSTDYPKG